MASAWEPKKRRRVAITDYYATGGSTSSSWNEHLSSHKKEDPGGARCCSKCQWAAKRAWWQQRTPLDADAGVKASWLQARPLHATSSVWGVGCKACRWAAKNCCQGPLGSSQIRRQRHYDNYVKLTVTGGGASNEQFQASRCLANSQGSSHPVLVSACWPCRSKLQSRQLPAWSSPCRGGLCQCLEAPGAAGE